MRCGSCGAEITPGHRFCSRCGATVAEPLTPGEDSFEETDVEEDPAELDATPREEPARRRLRRLLIAAGSLAAVAALGGCVLLGWLLNGWIASDPAPVSVTVTRPITVIEEEPQQTGSMPSVVGLDEATARQVLIDAGIDLERVSTQEQPYAGPAGLVVDQTPVAGTELASDEILLGLSVAATMPDVVEATLDEARATLSELGATVQIESRYEPGADENDVLETDPVAGAALADRVVLVVAEPPSSVFLAELNPIDSSCSADSLNVAGRPQPNSLVCQPYDQDDTEVMEYTLNGRVASFAAIVGLGDRGATDVPVTFRVIVDGRRAVSVTVPFGSTRRLRVPVVGALRIRLEAAIPRPSESGNSVEAVFAEARFLGGRNAIDDLVAESNQ